MLPRWLTALPRLAITYRDEMLIVALGLVYQAAVTRDHAPRGAELRDATPVVVRIADRPHAAAAAEHAMLAAMEASVQSELAALEAARAVAALPHLEHAAHAAAHAAPRPRAVPRPAPRPAPSRARAVAPADPVDAVAPAAPLAPVVRVGGSVRAAVGTVPGRRVRVVIPADAGENIAAALEVSADAADTMVQPEVRRALERIRPSIDEARLRAALQKALAAEQATRRNGQGA